MKPEDNTLRRQEQELKTACEDLSRILGKDASADVHPEKLIAAFTAGNAEEKWYHPDLSPEDMEGYLAEQHPDLTVQTRQALSSPELITKGLTAFRRWAMAGFSLVSAEEREKRMAACRRCEFFSDAPSSLLYQVTATHNICTVCGCSVEKKIRLSTEHCPATDPENPDKNRWGELL